MLRCLKLAGWLVVAGMSCAWAQEDTDCTADCSQPDDGAVTCEVPLVWYLDQDNDGYGLSTQSRSSCRQPQGYTLAVGDCDDLNAQINPGAPEVCNGKDDDCDGIIDNSDSPDLTAWWPDADGDGYGDANATPVRGCTEPEPGFTPDGGDCDDTNPEIHPMAQESCEDGAPDLNCDGYTGREDADGDGFMACEDCDDGDPHAKPGARDRYYDGLILDCRRKSDFDRDGDGHWADFVGGDDCDDTNPEIHPGAQDPERDGVDWDCDGFDGPPPEAPSPESTGCRGCNQAASPLWAVLLLLPLRLQRRTRPGSKTRTAP